MSDEKDRETAATDVDDSVGENQRPDGVQGESEEDGGLAEDPQGESGEDGGLADGTEEESTGEKGETGGETHSSDTGSGADNGQDTTVDGEEAGDSPAETDDNIAEEGLIWAGDKDNPEDGITWAGDEENHSEDTTRAGNEDNSDETSEAVSSVPDDTVTTGSGGSGDPQFAPEQDTDNTPVPADETFDDLAVEDVKADEIWAEVTEEERQELAESEAEDETLEEERELSSTDEVSKHDYCERCEYFSQAPEIRCTHEGTEILEFVDMDQVRVSNCPIVAERKGLEEGSSQGSTGLGDIQRD